MEMFRKFGLGKTHAPAQGFEFLSIISVHLFAAQNNLTSLLF